MVAILHGIILAFGLILPLGVQNVFVFTQGVMQPTIWRAAPAAVTAAICDTVLIVLAVLGLSVIVLQFEGVRLLLMCGGILFLLYMGKVIWSSLPPNIEEGQSLSMKKQVLFALSVSLLNPHALLDTIGVIGTSAVKYTGQEQVMFTVACIIVSWLWFFWLMIVGSILKKMQLPATVFTLFNKFSAVFIWGTACYLIYSQFIA